MARTSYPADSTHLSEFFSNDNDTHLAVPHYQRGYSWGQVNWDDYWEDLMANLDTLDEYYFGTIMTIKDTSIKKMDAYSLVDGQQRMMTTAIFLTVLRDIYNKIDSSLEDETEQQLFNTSLNPTDKLYYKIQLDDDDDPYVKDYIFKKIDYKTQDKLEYVKNSSAIFQTNENLKNAYICFYEYVWKEIENKSKKDKEDYLNNLRTTLRKRYVITNLEVTKESKAYVLFDRINNRGLPLATSDLVKDFLLSVIHEESSQGIGTISLKDAIRKWGEISRDEERKKTKLNIYLHHYLNAFHTKVQDSKKGKFIFKFCNKNQTYEKIENLITNSITAGEFLDDFHKKFQDYKILTRRTKNSPKLSDIAKTNLDWIKRMGIQIIMPVLMVGYQKYNKSDFEKLVSLCLTFFFRTKTISNENASALEKELAEIAYQIFHNNMNFKDVKDLLTKSQHNPSNTKFETDLAEAKLSGNTARYVLTKIIEKLQPPRISDIAPKTSLEHIMPQTPSSEWKKYIIKNQPEIQNENDVRAFIQNYKNRLGNLTLIDPLKNKGIGNNSFEDKVKKFRKSKIDITSEIHKWPVWNAKSILNRQKKLASIAKDIWKL